MNVILNSVEEYFPVENFTHAIDTSNVSERVDIRTTLYTGPAGWSYPDWESIVYPKGDSVDRLGFIARYFRCVELNSSFYQTPSTRLVRSWVDRIGHLNHFRMNIKVLQTFTHVRNLDRDGLLYFIDRFKPLEDKGRLGAFLLQFPWSFRCDDDNLRYLENLAEIFRGRPAAVEVRHGSWLNSGTGDFFTNNGLAFCNIDQPVIGDSISPSSIVTNEDVGYIRLHGRNYRNWFRQDSDRNARYDYLYDADELSTWTSMAVSMFGKVRNLFIITNNHFRGQAIANAFQLHSMINRTKVKMPASMVKTYPGLEAILDSTPEDLDLS